MTILFSYAPHINSMFAKLISKLNIQPQKYCSM